MELSGAFVRGVCQELSKKMECGNMPRQLTNHISKGLNEALEIVVLNEPGPGGACHTYRIAVRNGAEVSRGVCCDIEFQNGPIAETGVNGVSNEALLAVVEDRLAGFQSGPFACGSNQMALIHVQSAMDVLHARTKERVARGVEGTLQQ